MILCRASTPPEYLAHHDAEVIHKVPVYDAAPALYPASERTGPCLNCGRMYYGARWMLRKYCSPRCRKNYRHRMYYRARRALERGARS